MTLTEFLLARIAEDEDKIAHMERETRRVETAPIYQAYPPNWLAGVDIFVSPSRWQAECEAKRRFVDAYRSAVMDDSYWSQRPGADAEATSRARLSAWTYALTEMARVYADHPDYRDEWTPNA